jgi:hypothetical protein
MKRNLFQILEVLFFAEQKKVGLQNGSVLLKAKPASLHFLSLTLFIFFCFFQFSCAKKEDSIDYEKLFFYKVILDQNTKRNSSALSSCNNSYQVSLPCYQSSTSFSTIQLTETILSSALSRNRFNNFNDLCSNEILDLGPRLSDSVKACFFNCARNYYQTRRNLNSCINFSAEQIGVGILTDVGTSNCRSDCVRISNNNP